MLEKINEEKRCKRGTGTCIVPGCTRRQHSRGVCGSCYQIFQKAVKNGEITEKEALAAGIILPATKERASPMSTAIKEVRHRYIQVRETKDGKRSSQSGAIDDREDS